MLQLIVLALINSPFIFQLNLPLIMLIYLLRINNLPIKLSRLFFSDLRVMSGYVRFSQLLKLLDSNLIRLLRNKIHNQLSIFLLLNKSTSWNLLQSLLISWLAISSIWTLNALLSWSLNWSTSSSKEIEISKILTLKAWFHLRSNSESIPPNKKRIKN